MVGSLLSIAYATGTNISDTGIITPSLTVATVTVTGTCTGCGGEGSFTNYSTVLLNQTFGGSGQFGDGLLVSNTGDVTLAMLDKNYFVTSLGTVTTIGTSGNLGIETGISQSVTGTYKTSLNFTDATNNNLVIIKNQSVLQVLHINNSQFFNGSLRAAGASVGISPNGKYIAIAGQDSSGTTNRLLIFQGS